MKCIKATYPIEWENVNIYTLADLHIGDPHCDKQHVNAQIKRIVDDKHGLVVLNGDLLNTAIKASVSDVYGETLRPIDQIIELVDLLTPIKDRIIGATTGNHEARVYRMDGIDIMRLACRELGIEDKYHSDGVLIFLRFGRANGHKKHKDENPRQLFTIYATHGSGGGRKEGAKAIRLADMAAIVNADVYIHAHTHLPMIMKESAWRVSVASSSAALTDMLFVNTGASLIHGGYGQQQEFKPSSIETPVIHLNAFRATATATL